MKISSSVHLIRKEFFVTEDVKRFVNIYLVTGRSCYLIDCGVSGSEKLISDYMQSIGRKITDIKGIFLTHSHPDHIGASGEIKRQTGCRIYAPAGELPWIEDIHLQFRQRPIPNFFRLLSESAEVDIPLAGGDIITPEEGISVEAVSTPGHSHDSMSYVLNGDIIFTGDAITPPGQAPIIVDYSKSLESLDAIERLKSVQTCCPAWDDVYSGEALHDIIGQSRQALVKFADAVLKADKKLTALPAEKTIAEIFKNAGITEACINPLAAMSINACRKI